MDWKKSLTQRRKDAKNTSEAYGVRGLVGLRSKTSLAGCGKRAERPRGEAVERDARVDHRPGCAVSGKEAKLSYNGNLTIENRNGLIVVSEVFQANGTAERDAALVTVEQLPGRHRVAVWADKAYDTRGFVEECWGMNLTPHVAQNTKRSGGSAIDARTTRHEGYETSQRKRKRAEERFGWLKTIALTRKVRHRGIHKVGWVFTLAAAAYNLVRMKNLLASSVGAA